MSDQEPVARLPDAAREAFAEPMGPIYTDAERLLAAVSGPVIAVGDVVTHHLLDAGRRPVVAVIDRKTQRGDLDPAVAATLDALQVGETVPNDPATLSAELVAALVEAIHGDAERVIAVDGEEDLATLPAVLAAPEGWSVVYGQPNEGMVRIEVTDETRKQARDLAEKLETTDRFWELLA